MPADDLSLNTRNLVVRITGPGPPEVLQQGFSSIPAPGPDEVLIEVKAAGVNRHDCNQRRAGKSRDGSDVPGLEVSGTIVSVGSSVTSHCVGDEVVALTPGGGYAQFVATDAGLVLPRPACLSWPQAAALPEALFTAWFNIFSVMRLASGESVLIHGGTSGVASVAMQALATLGVKIISTSGDEVKREAALGFGASASFNYNDPELAEQVKLATGGAGVDAILDTSAGAHIEADFEMLAVGGRISHLSAGGGKTLSVPLTTLMAKRIAISGSLLRPLPISEKRRIAAILRQEVWPFVEAGRVRPPIAATFPLARASDAHRLMEAGQHVGKIMLTV